MILKLLLNTALCVIWFSILALGSSAYSGLKGPKYEHLQADSDSDTSEHIEIQPITTQPVIIEIEGDVSERAKEDTHLALTQPKSNHKSTELEEAQLPEYIHKMTGSAFAATIYACLGGCNTWGLGKAAKITEVGYTATRGEYILQKCCCNYGWATAKTVMNMSPCHFASTAIACFCCLTCMVGTYQSVCLDCRDSYYK